MSAEAEASTTATTEAEQSAPDKPAENKEQENDAKKHDPVRRNTKIIAAVVAFLFVWYIAADRLAPWTDQARVQGFVIALAPKVAGKVKKVNVELDQIVQGGDLLLQIDQRDYQIAVQQAESELELAGQETGAGTAAVATAQASLVDAEANLAHIQIQAKRIFEVEKKGVVSKAEGDKARATVKQAEAQVDVAVAELEKAKQQLGKKGKNNPRVRAAIAALNQAQINLAETSIISPGLGIITNLKLDEGHYAQPGVPLMTFISADDVWVQANFRENSIGNMKIGSKVDITLDVAPGKVFPGEVTSIGAGVDQPSEGEIGGLITIKGDSGWLRDAQRFPVIIHFADDSARGFRRVGGQADIQVYGSNWLLNGLGWIWIRILSVLSFIY